MVFVVGAFGLALGSFINVLIDRLPRGESVVFVRSHCDWCRRTLSWYELIPIFSYLVQRGRCRRCRHRLSLQYPVVEIVSALLLITLYRVLLGNATAFIAWGVIALSLFAIFVTDLKYSIIPDSLVIAGVIGALYERSLPFRIHGDTPLLALVISGIGGSLFLFFLYSVTRGRGMGLGDVKLAFLLGFLSGFPGIAVTLTVAFLTGAGAGVILILTGKKTLKSHVPFGPFLILGQFASLVWGQSMVTWWKGFI
jgi:leader peptidase (prepilin peptidase)/N-methyltransferase